MLVSILLSLCLIVPPVAGPLDAPFRPTDSYAGHWGVDLSVPEGSEVVVPADGVVTFAGEVAGMKTVTIRVAGGLRVSLSYLSRIRARVGERVVAGQPVGRSGRAHGKGGLHLSVRDDGRYIDPAPFLRCVTGTIRLLEDR